MEVETTVTRHAAQGARIRTARQVRGWTEDELAAAVLVGQPTVVRWERGETQPLYDKRRRLVEELAVPYHRIFVPEDVASQVRGGPRRLLLTAHGLPGSTGHLYIETLTKGPERSDAVALARFLLVEDNGWDAKRRRYTWHVSPYGEDVLGVFRGE